MPEIASISAFRCGIVVAALGVGWLRAESPASGDLSVELSRLAEQNERLMQMVLSQQAEIAALRQRLEAVDEHSQAQAETLRELQESRKEPSLAARRPSFEDRVNIMGEAGIAFFAGGAQSLFPESQFRVDEARLFVEAEAVRGVYFFSEIEFSVRESRDENMRMGELYLEIEDLGSLFGTRGGPTLRAGRLDIPFGVEYMERDVMDNVLISHSLADLWGIDEGVEVYGSIGKVSYIVAVQNGSVARLTDYDGDKAVTARLGYSPVRGFDLSASFFRSGSLSIEEDERSEMWIGNGWFIPVGGDAAETFSVEMAQLDAAFSWRSGHLKAFYGMAWYDDDDPDADQSRRLDFWSLEAKQDLTDSLYAAARLSAIDANEKGYPLPGHGNRGRYYWSGALNAELTRLSVGLGYRPFDTLVFKVEYAWEDGHQLNGSERTETDIFATEVGVSF